MTRKPFSKGVALGSAAMKVRTVDHPFALPLLPDACDALESCIDAQTKQIHYDKHPAYVDNLNRAVAQDPSLAQTSVKELLQGLHNLPVAVRTRVRNQGGSHFNHTLFWQTLAPAAKSGDPSGELAQAINHKLGDRGRFEGQLRAAAVGVLGSGSAWLSLNPASKLVLETALNQDSPLLAKNRPLLGIEVREHADYFKYQNRRVDFLAAVVKVINWDFVPERCCSLSHKRVAFL